MKIPQQIVITTKEYIQIQTKLNLYIAKYGCKVVEMYLDTIPIKMQKKDGKFLGAFIAGKVCKEFQITNYQLFESTERHKITQARQLLCVLVEKYLQLSRVEIAAMFNRSRHFSKRMLTDFYERLRENHPLDQPFLERYHKLDMLIKAYVDFTPKNR